MAEYIEREALDKAFLLLGYAEGDLPRRMLAQIPATDVAPVRHGRWVRIRTARYNGMKPYTSFERSCSICNWRNKNRKGWNHKYCHNCCAKMDLEE